MPTTAMTVVLLLGTPAGLSPDLAATPITASKLKVAHGKVFFYVRSHFTKARIKDIPGFGKRVTGRVNMRSGEIRVDVDVRDFSTRNRGRDKDMHEDVLNSSRYKTAAFRGRILAYDSTTGKVRARGVLTLHGKQSKLALTGTVKKTKSGWRLRTVFPVSLKEHGIKPPRNLYVLSVGNRVRVKLFLYFRSAD